VLHDLGKLAIGSEKAWCAAWLARPKGGVMRLDPGNRFPNLTVALVAGGEARFPEDVGTGWAVLLFYRGHW
jgi:hypothetical protein